MKILSVRFRNISALKGEFEVHFDRPPLIDAGIFAIVGPNGSGKSSILDALTLALYGETPRLKSPDTEILHRSAGDAYAEASFSLGGITYRSEWSIRRDGDLTVGPEMRLLSLEQGETILEDRLAKVRDYVADLTGLDFKRFCRSVLLAQGDFSAFLNALESERAEIMEKIVGTEMTRELEESVRAGLEAETERLLQFKESLGGYSIMDKEQLDGLRDSLHLAESQLEETDGLLETLKTKVEWYDRQDLLVAAHAEAAESLAQAEGRYNQLRADKDRAKRAEKALPLRENVERYDALKETADRTAGFLHELEMDIRTHNDRILALEDELRESRGRLDRAREDLGNQEEVMRDALFRDREIEVEESTYGEAVSQQSKLEEAHQGKLRKLSEIEDRLADTLNFRQEIHGWLQRHACDSGLGSAMPDLEKIVVQLKDIRRELEDCQTRETDSQSEEQRTTDELNWADNRAQKALKRMEKAASRKAGHVERGDELLEGSTTDGLIEEFQTERSRLALFKRLLEISRNYRKNALGEVPPEVLAQIDTEQEKLAESLGREEGLLSELEETFGWYQARRRLASDRLILKPGNPCPLCGALEHRLEELDSVDNEPGAESALQKQRERVGSLKNEIKALGDKAVGLHRKMSATESANSEWEDTCGKAGVEYSITTQDDLDEGIRSCKIALRRLKSRIRGVRWHGWWAQLADRRLQRKTEKYSERERSRDELRSKLEVEAKTLSDFRNKLEGLRRQERETKEDLAQRLGSLHEPVPEEGMEEDLLSRFKERWEYYSRQSRDSGALEEQLPSLQMQRQELMNEVEQSKERVAMLEEEIQTMGQRLSDLKAERLRLFGELDPISDRRALENEISLRDAEQLSLNREIDSVREELLRKQSLVPQAAEEARDALSVVDVAGRELMALLPPLDFNSIDQLREDLYFQGTQEDIEEQIKAAEVLSTEVRSRLEAARADLERVPDQPSETVREGMAETTRKRDILLSKIQDIYHTLERQRKLEGAYLEALEAVREQEKVCSRAKAELSMLQSGDSGHVMAKLRRFMLERLIEKANEHLEILSGRYSLRPISEEGLGIQVLDSLQGNACRPLKTLSGGESFLASLCLALGLSGMASKDRKIESLFLDEGFGTLDDEMLYKVVAALKTLRSNGKMVGVISHVKRLADEIPTQIRVEKLSDGSSSISVVA